MALGIQSPCRIRQLPLRWNRTLFVVVLFLAVAQFANGQRVIASLGTKLKRLHNKSTRSKKSGDGYVIEGEEEKPTAAEFLEKLLAQENNVELFVAFSVLMVTIYLLSFWNKTTQKKEEEGELYHERPTV